LSLLTFLRYYMPGYNPRKVDDSDLIRKGRVWLADMRAATMVEGLDRDLGASGLVLESETNLSPGVVSALDAVNERKMSRIQKSTLMQRFLKEFSGTRGLLLYRNLQSGGVVYLARRYRKPLV
jgi:hypothetical protein